MKDARLMVAKKGRKIQHCADTHNTKKFFNALKMVYGSSQSGCSSLLTSDGSNLIKDQAGWKDHWAEYFSNLLNLPSTIDAVALNQLMQQPFIDELDASFTLDEIKKAISQLNTSRASGKDGIPAEIYKAASPNTLETFHHVLKSIWDEEEMPEDFRDALTVTLSTGIKAPEPTVETTGVSLCSQLLAISSLTLF